MVAGERKGLEGNAAERRTQRLLGLSYFLLVAYIALNSGADLPAWLPEPQLSPEDVGTVVASAVVMGGFYVSPIGIAIRMDFQSLGTEAMESLFCEIQDLTILVRLGVNVLLSWWWANPGIIRYLARFLR